MAFPLKATEGSAAGNFSTLGLALSKVTLPGPRYFDHVSVTGGGEPVKGWPMPLVNFMSSVTQTVERFPRVNSQARKCLLGGQFELICLINCEFASKLVRKTGVLKRDLLQWNLRRAFTLIDLLQASAFELRNLSQISFLYAVERNFGISRVTVFARFNLLFGLLCNRRIDDDQFNAWSVRRVRLVPLIGRVAIS